MAGSGKRLPSADEKTPERRELASTIRLLFDQMAGARVKKLEYLSARLGRTSPRLSRYQTGAEVPSERVLARLYEVACEDLGSHAVGITLSHLLVLRDQALRTCQFAGCPRRGVRPGGAGCQQSSVEGQESAHLPVPLRAGDRQVSEFDPVVRRLAERAAGLFIEGAKEAAFTVLAEAPQRLSPAENAACIHLLRQRHDATLADTLAHISGRERPEIDVIWLARELLDCDLTDDARTVLDAARA